MANERLGKTERAQAGEALRDSESRYRRISEIAKDGILILDAVSGQITDINPFIYPPVRVQLRRGFRNKVWEIAPFHDYLRRRIKHYSQQKRLAEIAFSLSRIG